MFSFRCEKIIQYWNALHDAMIAYQQITSTFVTSIKQQSQNLSQHIQLHQTYKIIEFRTVVKKSLKYTLKYFRVIYRWP